MLDPTDTYQKQKGQTSCQNCQKGACSVGIGECLEQGTYTCNPKAGSSCNAKAGTPQSETCNGKYDDCDGQTDEDGAWKLSSKTKPLIFGFRCQKIVWFIIYGN